MKNKQFCIFISALVLLNSNIYLKTTYAQSNLQQNLNEENIYLENEHFKIIYLGSEKNPIMPINSLKVFNKQNNKQIGDSTWSSALLLKNGNCILGNFVNGKYSYYELNKTGELNFLISIDYYIKDIIEETGDYIILEPIKQSYLFGILDNEFKVVYKPIFEYNNNIKFKNGLEILKPLNKKYGLYSIDGIRLIEPIFESLNYNENNTINAVYNNKTYLLEKHSKGYKNATTIKTLDFWARDSVLNCIELGLVSDSLQLKFKQAITRQEFCELIIDLYEMKTGLKVNISKVKNPFLDTKNEKVLKAYTLGIVNGKSTNKFEPNSYITREEVAVILYNLMGSMGIPMKEKARVYEDNDKISDWAFNPVVVVSANGIMEGSNGFFRPKDKITVQEALVIIYRLH